MSKLNFEWMLKGNRIDETFILYNEKELSDWSNVNSNTKDKELGNYLYDYYLNRISVSDYILDAYSVYLMKEYKNFKVDGEQRNEVNSYINDKLQYNYKVQLWLEILKIDLSHLQNIKINENNDYSSLMVIIEKIVELKKLCRTFDIDSIKNIVEEIINSDFSLLNNELYDLFSKKYSSLKNLLDVGYLNKEKILLLINNIIKNIPKNLNPDNHQAYIIIKSIINHTNNHKKYSNIECLKMILSKESFENGKEELKRKTKKKMQDIQMITRIYNENQEMYDNLFLEDNNLIKLKNFFKDKRILSISLKEEKYLNKKYSDDSGCFGILETKNNNYFALSGENDYKGSIHSCLSCEQEIENLANEINKSLFNGGYVWATLNDEVERYINHDYDKRKKNLSYIHPVKLKNDKAVIGKAIGIHYACCERKMQAECNNWSINKTYYSRWEPCEKCLPSFNKESGNVSFFYLSKNYNTYKMGEVKLQEIKLEK